MNSIVATIESISPKTESQLVKTGSFFEKIESELVKTDSTFERSELVFKKMKSVFVKMKPVFRETAPICGYFKQSLEDIALSFARLLLHLI